MPGREHEARDLGGERLAEADRHLAGDRASASSLIGPDAASSSASVTPRADQADQHALEDERPADERIRRADQSHDLDLVRRAT